MGKNSQVIAGEKLKAILKANYGSNSLHFKYQDIGTSGSVGLLITGQKANFISQVRTLLGNNFNINESRINSGLDERLNIIICLSEISVESLSKLNHSHKSKFPDWKIDEEAIEAIIKKDLKSLQQKPEKKDDITSPEIVLDQDQKDLETTSIADSEIAPKIAEEKKVSNPKDIERFRSSLSVFLSHVSTYEKRFKSSTMNDLNNSFSYGESIGYVQMLYCKDESIAYGLEFAIRWFINGYDNLSVSRKDYVVKVDCFPFLNQKIARKPLMGAFCLAPNGESDLVEIQDRLKKIAIMTRPVVKPCIDCFEVLYSRNDTVYKIHNLISSMGWKSEIQNENVIMIVTGPNPVVTSTTNRNFVTKEKPEDKKVEKVAQALKQKKSDPSLIEVKDQNSHKVANAITSPKVSNLGHVNPQDPESISILEIPEDEKLPKSNGESVLEVSTTSVIVKTSLVGELKKANFNYQKSLQFSGSKSEALEKLQGIHLNQEVFLTFSPENQQKISDVLGKYWLKEHLEDYVMSIVDFLELNLN